VIPVIDITGLADGDAAVVEAIGAACRSTGFFSVVGHGVDPSLRAAVFDQAHRFFALPPDAKAAVASATEGPSANRGYDGLRSQRLDAAAAPDLKESFMIGRELGPEHPLVQKGLPMHGPNRWPAELPGFREALTAYQDAAFGLAALLLRGIASSLGLEAGFFAPFHREPILGLRLMRYPPRPAGLPADQFGAGAHTDWGGITVLAQDDVGSLQVRSPVGDWWDVPPDPDAFVINLGDLMGVWTNDRYRSTVHRVLGGDRERYSVALFCDLDAEARIEVIPTCTSADDPPRYEPTTVLDHLLGRFTASMTVTSRS
jgi:isopenicillin N synthase-like dioxygenase